MSSPDVVDPLCFSCVKAVSVRLVNQLIETVRDLSIEHRCYGGCGITCNTREGVDSKIDTILII